MLLPCQRQLRSSPPSIFHSPCQPCMCRRPVHAAQPMRKAQKMLTQTCFLNMLTLPTPCSSCMRNSHRWVWHHKQHTASFPTRTRCGRATATLQTAQDWVTGKGQDKRNRQACSRALRLLNRAGDLPLPMLISYLSAPPS